MTEFTYFIFGFSVGAVFMIKTFNTNNKMQHQIVEEVDRLHE